MLKVYSIANVESQQKAVDTLAKILPFGQFKESAKKEQSEEISSIPTTTQNTRSASS
jgi:hypothetical protein